MTDETLERLLALGDQAAAEAEDLYAAAIKHDPVYGGPQATAIAAKRGEAAYYWVRAVMLQLGTRRPLPTPGPAGWAPPTVIKKGGPPVPSIVVKKGASVGPTTAQLEQVLDEHCTCDHKPGFGRCRWCECKVLNPAPAPLEDHCIACGHPAHLHGPTSCFAPESCACPGYNYEPIYTAQPPPQHAEPEYRPDCVRCSHPKSYHEGNSCNGRTPPSPLITPGSSPTSFSTIQCDCRGYRGDPITGTRLAEIAEAAVLPLCKCGHPVTEHTASNNACGPDCYCMGFELTEHRE